MKPDLTRYASQTISSGSRSFAAAARLFGPDTRRSTMLLYAWCRYCDDLVDGQHLGHRPLERLNAEPSASLEYLKAETLRALTGQPVQQPAFAALQAVADKHRIPPRYPLEHLQGFAMDVQGYHYQSFEDTLKYCYHVAGVVGIMMALIMGVQEESVLDRACDLGIAFQLTNMAQDIVEDAQAGRCYLPEDWLKELALPREKIPEPPYRRQLATLARRLITEAEPYYQSAQMGLSALPFRSAWAIAAAHSVYREIGIKVHALGEKAWDTRVSTAPGDKLRLLTLALFTALSSRYVPTSPRSPELWQRPA